MGQKVNPIGFRVGNIYNWNSRWFAKDKKYKEYLQEDINLRHFLTNKLKHTGISKIEIERSMDKRMITLHVSRPGMVIGRGGTGLEELKKTIMGKLKLEDGAKLDIKVEEIKKPDLDAYLVALVIADQLIKRIPARRVKNQAVQRVMRAGAKGVKVALAGRIGGADIARRESQKDGTVPLHTLRANIDFGKVDALTKSGFIGVKVWINKGEL
jgi:small subunit ribosomal protein S3